MARIKDKVEEKVIKDEVKEKNANKDIKDKSKTVKKTPPKKVNVERDRMVLCKNITSGTLIYVSKKSGAEYIWENYGDEEWIDVAELLTMKSSQKKFLTEPWLMIDDSEVVDYLGLRSIYDKFVDINDIEDFFNKTPNEMKSIFKDIPNGIRQLIGEKAREMVADNKLYDVRKIKVIEEELNIDLSLVSK